MAGKFNLSKFKGIESLEQIQSADIGRGHALGSGLLNEQSKKQNRYEKSFFVKFEDLVPSSMNKFSKNPAKIAELSESIGYVGLLDPLIVTQLEDEKWMILSGETRYWAINDLREKGRWNEEDVVECKRKDIEDIDLPLEKDDKQMLVLLSGNINRNKTDADKMFEIRNWKMLIAKLRKQGVEILMVPAADGTDQEESKNEGIRISGEKTRDIISKQMGMSPAQVGIFESVDNNGTDALKEALLGNRVPVNVAANIAKLPEKEQNEMISKTLKKKHENEMITQDDLRKYKEKKEKSQKAVVAYDKDQLLQDMDRIFSYMDRKSGVELTESNLDKCRKKIAELERLIGIK